MQILHLIMFKVENLDEFPLLVSKMWVQHVLGAISALLDVYHGNSGI